GFAFSTGTSAWKFNGMRTLTFWNARCTLGSPTTSEDYVVSAHQLWTARRLGRANAVNDQAGKAVASPHCTPSRVRLARALVVGRSHARRFTFGGSRNL